MVTGSDNLATILLSNNLPDYAFEKVYKDLGIPEDAFKSDVDKDVISVKDYASFFRILYNASYLSKFYSEKALSILSSSQFSDGLEAGIPENVVVAHKFGERVDQDAGQVQLHDCGVVYTSNPYLLCIMTKGKDINEQSLAIAEISRMTFNYFGSN